MDNEDPRSSGLRSILWKSYLLFVDGRSHDWRHTISESRSTYSELHSHFILRAVDQQDDSGAAADPLTDDDQSPWTILRRDDALRAEIIQDVERCMPENVFFREVETQRKLSDILFVYCKLNADVGYRQGMHELLAPFLWVVEQDAIKVERASEAGSSTGLDGLMSLILDARFVEHDAFNLFAAVMRTAKGFYELDDPKPSSYEQTPGATIGLVGHAQRESPIIRQSRQIHEGYLATVDAELAGRLEEIDVLPQIFLIRWIRLLFEREFPFDDLLSLWDALFVIDPALSLVDYICVAMILRIRDQLMEADYSSALTLLLRYPQPSAPHSPATFVADAFYLRANLSPAGGAHIIAKYSTSKILSSDDPSTRQSKDNSMPGSYPWSQPLARGSSSSTSPARLLPSPSGLGIEAVLQDAAKGVLKQGERWGVNKAVRDAVVEVRKGLQSAGSSPRPSLDSGRASRWSLDDGRPIQSSTAEELNDVRARVEELEARNKSLAKMLGAAIEGFWSQRGDQNGGVGGREDEAAQEKFNLAVAKVQFVQVYLDDPSLELPMETDPSRRSATMEVVADPVKVAEQTVRLPDSPKTLRTRLVAKSLPAVGPSTTTGTPVSPAKAKASSATPRTPVLKKATTTLVAVSPASKVARAEQSPTRRPRSSLAQSSFAWMLGDEKEEKDAVATFPSPGSSERKGSRASKGAAFLFGDEGEESRPSKAELQGRDGVVNDDEAVFSLGTLKKRAIT